MIKMLQQQNQEDILEKLDFDSNMQFKRELDKKNYVMDNSDIKKGEELGKKLLSDAKRNDELAE